MLNEQIFKPSHDEWLRWSQVVIDRLAACVHVYSKPPHDDVFIAEKDRQEKNARTLDLLRRVYALIDEAETPTDSLADVAHHDERVISGLVVLMKETLDALPELSTDMQRLLKSPWYDRCNGGVANELFRGPMDNQSEGIGSGHPEHRRLPLALYNLIEREKIGEGRQPREALHRHQVGNPHRDVGDGPQRSDDEHDVKRRWADKNSRHLRSAGRID